MNLTELKELVNDLESVIYDRKSDKYETWLSEKDSPDGMNKSDWNNLIITVNDLRFMVDKEIIQQEKSLLMA